MSEQSSKLTLDQENWLVTGMLGVLAVASIKIAQLGDGWAVAGILFVIAYAALLMVVAMLRANLARWRKS